MHLMVARLRTLFAALFLMMTAVAAGAQTAADPIRYTVSFPAPHTHYVDVSAAVPSQYAATCSTSGGSSRRRGVATRSSRRKRGRRANSSGIEARMLQRLEAATKPCGEYGAFPLTYASL